MFIIALSIFTLILTVFENIFVAIGALILILVAVKFHPGANRFRLGHPGGILLIIGAFLLSLTSILVKNYTYTQKIDNISHSTGLISQNMDGPKGSYFVGIGQISDIYSYQRYVFQDNSNRQYFLNSANKYQIGDKIRLNGYVSPAYTGSKNIFNLKYQRNNILKKPNLSGLLNYEFDYPKRLMMKGFYGTIYEQNGVITSPLSPLLGGEGENIHQTSLSFKEREVKSEVSFLQSIRKSLQQKIIYAYGENPKAGLVLGMLVGDRSQIPPDEYDGFIDSGLVHIIAVSGGNIIMIVVFLGFVLFFLPFYVRNAVILLTIILYAMICGLDSSVFRATIMGGLGMLALFRGREINIRRAMSIAFIVMLLVNPYFLAYDVGFLLSFSAIIGIVYFGKWVDTLSDISLGDKIKQSIVSNNKTSPCHCEEGSNPYAEDDKNRLLRALPTGQAGSQGQMLGTTKFFQKFTKEYITPTIGATLGVLPVMLFFMGKTNLTGIIANFLVVPIIAVVMIYGFISTMLFQIFPRQFILWPEKILITYIYSISDFASRRGIYLQAEGYWVKYALLAVFIVWFVSERTKK